MRRHRFIAIAMWLALTLLSSKAAAQEVLRLDYATFYSHLNKLDDEDMPALQFGFGFKKVLETRLCKIKHVNIETQKVTIDVVVRPNQRFVLPTEKALKQAKAVVNIVLAEPANQCDMSVQLETKADYLKHSYSKQELQNLFAQYSAFFDNMGSFLSFLMPGVTGLNMYFGPGESPNHPMLNQDDNMLYLEQSGLEKLTAPLVFEYPPILITGHTQ